MKTTMLEFLGENTNLDAFFNSDRETKENGKKLLSFVADGGIGHITNSKKFVEVLKTFGNIEIDVLK